MPAGDGLALPVAYHDALQHRLREVLDAFDEFFLTNPELLPKIREVIDFYWALRDQLGLDLERALPLCKDEDGSSKVCPSVRVPRVDRLAHDRQAPGTLIQTLRLIGGGKTNSRTKPGRPAKSKPDKADRAVANIAKRLRRTSERPDWKTLLQEHADSLPKKCTPDALRKRVSRYEERSLRDHQQRGR